MSNPSPTQNFFTMTIEEALEAASNALLSAVKNFIEDRA